MKKTVPVILLALCATGVMAGERHTLTAGYSEMTGNSIYGISPSGVALNYFYEPNDTSFGWVMSGTMTSGSNQYKPFPTMDIESTAKIKYSSFRIGPSYRVNDEISVYATAGFAKSKVDLGSNFGSVTDRDVSYSIGAKYAPAVFGPVAFDVQYENSPIRMSGQRMNNGFLSIGAGFSF